MITWHPSAAAPGATFDDPFTMLSLGFLGGGPAPDARADLGQTLRATLQAAENAVRPEGTAIRPSGFVLDATGMLESIDDYDADYAYDDEAVFSALNTMCNRIRGRAGKLRCTALSYHVWMPVPGGGVQEVVIRRSTEWQQGKAVPPPGTVAAVAADLEHRAGVAVSVFLPYERRPDGLYVGAPLAVPGRRRTWG